MVHSKYLNPVTFQPLIAYSPKSPGSTVGSNRGFSALFPMMTVFRDIDGSFQRFHVPSDKDFGLRIPMKSGNRGASPV